MFKQSISGCWSFKKNGEFVERLVGRISDKNILFPDSYTDNQSDYLPAQLPLLIDGPPISSLAHTDPDH